MPSHSHASCHNTLTAQAMPLSLFLPCHYRNSFCTISTSHHATISAHATPISLLTLRHSHCSCHATVMDQARPPSLFLSCHYHSSFRATVTAHATPLQLLTSCHSHWSCHTTLTVHATPPSLVMPCHSRTSCRTTLTAHVTPLSQSNQCHEHTTFRATVPATHVMPFSLVMPHPRSLFMRCRPNHLTCSCHATLTLHATPSSLFMPSRHDCSRRPAPSVHASPPSLLIPRYPHCPCHTLTVVTHATLHRPSLCHSTPASHMACLTVRVTPSALHLSIAYCSASTCFQSLLPLPHFQGIVPSCSYTGRPCVTRCIHIPMPPHVIHSDEFMQIRCNASGCKSGACTLWLNAVRIRNSLFRCPLMCIDNEVHC